jgi:formylglycine-generating enzyme required for sulfatase activity
MATQWIEGYRIEVEHGRTPELQLWAARQLQQDAPVLLQIWETAGNADRGAMRQLAAQRHPGLAVVLDIGQTADGKLYVALNGLPGPSLAERLRQGMDLEQACSMFRRLALILHHLQIRGDLLPGLDADSIFNDAQGRPVVTRLHQASAEYRFDTCVRRLGVLMHEALTGYAPADDHAQLPDYLRRWQLLMDSCLQTGRVDRASDLIAQLDSLEGRQAAAPAKPTEANPAVTQVPAPTADVAASAATAVASSLAAATATGNAAAAAAASTSTSAAQSRSTSAPAGNSAAADALSSAPVRRADSSAASARAAATSAADSVAVDSLRTTAPSRRLEPEPNLNPVPSTSASRTQSRLPGAEPMEKPSRLPLYAALSLGLPLLLLFAWWALTWGEQAAPPPASAVASPAAPPIGAPGDLLYGSPGLPDPRQTAAHAGASAPSDLDQDAVSERSIELDLAALPTVEDPVARFILFGRANLQAGRLIDPPQRNALERFQLALRIEPGNREARDGIAEVAQRCLAEAEAAPSLDLQLQALSCVDSVAAAHEAGQPAAAEAQAMRLRGIERRLAAAAVALADWRAEDASALYAEALRLDPDSESAKAGQAEAQRQGTPGYRFSDPLRSGGRGPQLQIVGPLAWGRFEVSVDEYARYWERAGKARFGSSLPTCRDRESVFRGSRRRGWQAPDLPQGDDHPVVCINAAMADHYVEWLSAETGQRYRLPGRAEWQAVAGAPPPVCSINLRDQTAAQALSLRSASECSDGHAYTAPVRAAGGDSGLLGLWGNAGEWLADCEGSSCRERLVAGGSWFSAADELQPRGFAAEPGFTTIGLRVVRELSAAD